MLEIGTGSGYQAAILVAMQLDVYTIEIVPGDPDPFTPFGPYLARFFPENSRFLRIFTASPRRFQRAPSRNPGPRNGGRRAKTG